MKFNLFDSLKQSAAIYRELRLRCLSARLY